MYLIRNKATKETIRRSATPPRADGKLPDDLDPNVEILIEVKEDQPPFNAATQKLVSSPREEAGNTGEPINLIFGWAVTPLTVEELAVKQAAADNEAARAELKLILSEFNQEKATPEQINRAIYFLLMQHTR